MGMYDTINGEQVKCFPWVSLYNDEISYHGGELRSYETGSEVPYKQPHYNYGSNFVILDLNRYPEISYSDYDFILHVIENGKVAGTYKDELCSIDWAKNKSVVSYHGELLAIHSSEDILTYIKEQRAFWQKHEEIRSHWLALFKESGKYFTGIGLLEKDSEERKFRLKKLEELYTLMDEEEHRIKPKLDALSEAHSKWSADTPELIRLVELGDYISAYYTELRAERESARTCSEMIRKLLSADDTLYDKYLAWQELSSLEHFSVE